MCRGEVRQVVATSRHERGNEGFEEGNEGDGVVFREDPLDSIREELVRIPSFFLYAL